MPRELIDKYGTIERQETLKVLALVPIAVNVGQDAAQYTKWANAHGVYLQVDCAYPVPKELKRVLCDNGKTTGFVDNSSLEAFVMGGGSKNEHLTFLKRRIKLKGDHLGSNSNKFGPGLFQSTADQGQLLNVDAAYAKITDNDLTVLTNLTKLQSLNLAGTEVPASDWKNSLGAQTWDI